MAPSGSTSAESRSGRIGPIILEAKQTGERSAGNPHAAFDEAGAGNVARPRWCDTRRRKSEPTGNTNFGLNRRVSPRPYRRAAWRRIEHVFDAFGVDHARASDRTWRLLGLDDPPARPLDSMDRRAAVLNIERGLDLPLASHDNCVSSDRWPPREGRRKS